MAKRKKPMIKTVLLLLALLALAAACTVYFLFYFPYQQARTAMPQDTDLVLRENPDGTIHLSWPEAKGADLYLLEIYEAATRGALLGSDKPTLYSAVMPGQTECDLPTLSPDIPVTISIRSAAWYRTPREEKLRMGDAPLELTTTLYAPTVTIRSITPVPEMKTVTVNFDAVNSTASQLYLKQADGTYRQLLRSDNGAFTVTFGDGALLPLPGRTESYTFCIDGAREEPGLSFYGRPTVEFTVQRRELLGTNLNLRCENTGNNRYQLLWDETQGDRYVVQQLSSDGQWQQIGSTDIGTCSYTTGHQAVYTTCCFRVLAVNDDPAAESPYAAVSRELTVNTGASAIHATVWPLKDLPV